LIFRKGSIALDHVHLLLSIPPQLALSKIVQQLKGITSRKLQQEFPELRKRYWGQHFWARGYFVVSMGNVTTEMIKNYIEHHFEEDEQGENFRVET
jgi:putative transposase